MDYSGFIKWLSSVLRDRDIPWLLVGGWALGAYGVSRETVDLDLLLCEDDYGVLNELLAGRGYAVSHRTSLFARLQSDGSDDPELDVLFVEKATLDAMLAESQEFPLAGNAVRVPSLDHLIGMKWHSLAQSARTRLGRDMLDIVSLAAANGLDVRSASFRKLSLKYGNGQLYRSLLLLMPSPEEDAP